MNKDLKPGDILYAFMGEKLCEFTMIAYEDELRVSGSNDDERYCFYEESCYRTKNEALEGMGRFCAVLKDMPLD